MYCVKCRKRSPTKDERLVKTANGRAQLKGICTVCGCKKCQFVKATTGAGIKRSHK